MTNYINNAKGATIIPRGPQMMVINGHRLIMPDGYHAYRIDTSGDIIAVGYKVPALCYNKSTRKWMEL